MPAWLLWVFAAWRQRREIVAAGEAVVEAVESITGDAEPSNPLPASAVEHNRQQERSAIAANKAANAAKANADRFVDREAVTPPHGRKLPPLPPSKRIPPR